MGGQNAVCTPRIGEIYTMNFHGGASVQNGVRPGLVIQNDVGNLHSPNIIALPLTSAIKKMGQPTHVLLRAEDTGLSRDSIVLCENPECLSKGKIGKFITCLSDNHMKQVAEAYLLATSAVAFLDVEALLRVWRAALLLNSRRPVHNTAGRQAPCTTMR